MSEFEDKLHAILSDPAEMERITRLASELMGGGGEAQDGPDSALLRRIGTLLHGAEGGGDKAALLSALAPYLQPERRARLQKALRLAGVLRIAGAALREEGGAGLV